MYNCVRCIFIFIAAIEQIRTNLLRKAVAYDINVENITKEQWQLGFFPVQLSFHLAINEKYLEAQVFGSSGSCVSAFLFVPFFFHVGGHLGKMLLLLRHFVTSAL